MIRRYCVIFIVFISIGHTEAIIFQFYWLMEACCAVVRDKIFETFYRGFDNGNGLFFAKNAIKIHCTTIAAGKSFTGSSFIASIAYR